MCKMNTVNQTVMLCKEHGVGISRRMIRELAVTGKIPSVKVGNKILINWDGLMHYLETNTLVPEKAEQGVRKIVS